MTEEKRKEVDGKHIKDLKEGIRKFHETGPIPHEGSYSRKIAVALLNELINGDRVDPEVAAYLDALRASKRGSQRF